MSSTASTASTASLRQAHLARERALTKKGGWYEVMKEGKRSKAPCKYLAAAVAENRKILQAIAVKDLFANGLSRMATRGLLNAYPIFASVFWLLHHSLMMVGY